MRQVNHKTKGGRQYGSEVEHFSNKAHFLRANVADALHETALVRIHFDESYALQNLVHRANALIGVHERVAPELPRAVVNGHLSST